MHRHAPSASFCPSVNSIYMSLIAFWSLWLDYLTGFSNRYIWRLLRNTIVYLLLCCQKNFLLVPSFTFCLFIPFSLWRAAPVWRSRTLRYIQKLWDGVSAALQSLNRRQLERHHEGESDFWVQSVIINSLLCIELFTKGHVIIDLYFHCLIFDLNFSLKTNRRATYWALMQL